MASLIGWLAYDGARTSAGAAVASGSAWFFQPGTTATQVTVFSDEDGLAAVTQPVALDAGGRATVFTNSAVRVEIQDSTGATVEVTDRSNTITAAQVEIENTVATGTSLTTGAQVAGGRTDLNTFLSSLYTSLGASDGRVAVGSGSTALLKDALGGGQNIYNVKTYGAAGDGLADDTSAVQLAFDTAEGVTGGGIIFFPVGTYKLSSSLFLGPVPFYILGLSSAATVISQSANADVFVTDGAQLTALSITVTVAAGKTGDWVSGDGSVSAAGGHQFTNCVFSRGAGSVAGFDVTAGGVQLVNCAIGPSAVAVAGGLSMIGGALTWAEDGAGPLISTLTILSGVAILLATNTAGNHYLFDGAVSTAYTITGCTFTVSTSGGAILGLLSAVGAGSARLVESGCVRTSATTTTVVGGAAVPISSGVRDSIYTVVAGGSAITYTPNCATSKYVEVTTMGASFEWEAPTPVPPAGSAPEMVLIYINTSGGGVTPTLGAGISGEMVSVANGKACALHIVFVSGPDVWTQIGAVVAYTP